MKKNFFKTTPSVYPDDFLVRQTREGYPKQIQFSLTPGTTLLSEICVAGRAWVIKSATFSSEFAARVLINIGGPTESSDGPTALRMFLPGGYNTVSVPINEIVGANQSVSFSWQEAMVTGETQGRLQASFVVQEMTNDFNYDAEKTILNLGDSITYGATLGAARSYQDFDQHPYMIKQYFQSKGYDTRYINMGIGGTTSVRQLNKLRLNRYDIAKIDFITMQFGTNDYTVGEGVTVSQFKAAYQSMIDWFRTRTNAKILLLGPPSLLNTTNDASLNPYRIAASDVAITNASNGVFYTDLSVTFPAGSSTYLTDSIHPNKLGVQRMFLGSNLNGTSNGIQFALDQRNDWLDS